VVTTFQAARPLLIKSSEPNWRATLNGSVNDAVSVATRPIREVETASADSNVSGSRRLRKCGAVSGVMYGLSTMNTRSNLAASAFRALSMYQSMFTLASPGRSGSRQPFWVVPTPDKIAPSLSCLFAMVFSSYFRGSTASRSKRSGTNTQVGPAEVVGQDEQDVGAFDGGVGHVFAQAGSARSEADDRNG
jgi:ribosomal protein L25 (general stress protein Ctc)